MADLFVKNIGLLATPLRANDKDKSRPVDKIKNAAILIRNGRIEAVGKEESLLSKVPAGIPVFDASGMMVLPGLVDCHTHPVFCRQSRCRISHAQCRENIFGNRRGWAEVFRFPHSKSVRLRWSKSSRNPYRAFTAP